MTKEEELIIDAVVPKILFCTPRKHFGDWFISSGKSSGDYISSCEMSFGSLCLIFKYHRYSLKKIVKQTYELYAYADPDFLYKAKKSLLNFFNP
jgi:hypothetical protein